MPKSLISSQLDEKLSQPTSLSSKDGRVPLPPLPDVEGDIMEAVEMPNTHLSEGNQFSMPKSLSSQPDKILPRPFEGNRSSKRVSRRPLNRNKLTRAKGMQYGRELQKLKREVASLKAKRERNTSAGLDGGNADKRGTTPWQIFIPVYDDLKMMLRDFTRDDLRSDGRTCLSYRNFELECGVVSNTSGSARLKLSNTQVLVGVKAEMGPPNPLNPSRGGIEFFVDFSANASPKFAGRGGDELAAEISNMLGLVYKNKKMLDYKSLCVIAGQCVWTLYADIVVLECGGNLLDAIALAVKAALYNTRYMLSKIKKSANAFMSDDDTKLNMDAAENV
eukprot:XP_011675338.1 PREDICTED: exosome complex exonuclease RRP42-like [Strongylocentrotus purpuratus]